jgi:hypothetical protein
VARRAAAQRASLEVVEPCQRRCSCPPPPCSKYEVNLSTRPEKSVGSDDIWARSEAALQEALALKGWDYAVDAGGGAFYGPKIDIKVQDAIGRKWQCSTIQLDFNLPDRCGVWLRSVWAWRARWRGAGCEVCLVAWALRDLAASTPPHLLAVCPSARKVRHGLHRRVQHQAAAHHDPPRHFRLSGAIFRHPHRELRRGFPAVAGAHAGASLHPERISGFYKSMHWHRRLSWPAAPASAGGPYAARRLPAPLPLPLRRCGCCL